MHPSYPSCITHTKHKQRRPTHLQAATTCSRCKHHGHQTDHTKKKMKPQQREEDLELSYTHCLAHHLTGSRNTDNLAYPVVSKQSLTCNNTPVAVVVGNIYSCSSGSWKYLFLFLGSWKYRFLLPLILELRAKFPLLQFPQITSIDDLNWIGAFLFVDDLVPIVEFSSILIYF